MILVRQKTNKQKNNNTKLATCVHAHYSIVDRNWFIRSNDSERSKNQVGCIKAMQQKRSGHMMNLE